MYTKRKKIVLFFILAILLVALPTSSVLANKQAWKSAISYSNELHTVVNSMAKGTGNFGTNQDGSVLSLFQFVVYPKPPQEHTSMQ